MVTYHGPRAPRVGSHGRRLRPQERHLIFWALTREVSPASIAAVAEVFGISPSTAYRTKAAVAARLAASSKETVYGRTPH